jgi:hypothetical protein
MHIGHHRQTTNRPPAPVAADAPPERRRRSFAPGEMTGADHGFLVGRA